MIRREEQRESENQWSAFSFLFTKRTWKEQAHWHNNLPGHLREYDTPMIRKYPIKIPIPSMSLMKSAWTPNVTETTARSVFPRSIRTERLAKESR